MRLWLNLRDLFSYRAPVRPNKDVSFPSRFSQLLSDNSASDRDVNLQNVLFDNTMRLGVSLLSVAACFVLWLGQVIPKVSPILYLFFAYAAIQGAGAFFLNRVKQVRPLNFVLCSVDMIVTSAAIFLTGGLTSPLYFIYFLPLIIQAFHRDWNLLLFYGISGMICYTVVVALSVGEWTSTLIAAQAAKVFFMLVTIGIALLAVNLMRKEETVEQRRVSKLKFLTYVSETLNGLYALKELPVVAEEFVQQLNNELKRPSESWARIFLKGASDSVMQAVHAPDQPKPELKQTLPVHACPVMKSNVTFQLSDRDKVEPCPTESFSFGSHLCVPIAGTQNETYGVVFAGSPHPFAYDTEDIQFLEFIGKSIGLTIQRLKRLEELRNAAAMDSCAMASFVSSTRTPADTYAAILDGIKMITNADQACLMLWRGDRAVLETVAVNGEHPKFDWDLRFALGEGIPGRVLESRHPFWTYDLGSFEHFKDKRAPFTGLLCFPLHTLRDEPLGVMTVLLVESQRMFSVEEIDLASTFATRAAISLENSILHEVQRATVPIPLKKAA